MKKISSLLLLTIAMLTACKDSNNFVFNGKIENAGAIKKVFLYALNKQELIPVDSTILNDKNEFRFKRSAAEADFFKVVAGKGEYLFIAKNGDELNFSTDQKKEAFNYEIKGSDENVKLDEFNKIRSQYLVKLSALQKDFDTKVAQNPAARETILNEFKPVFIDQIKVMDKDVMAFAKKNEGSLAGFYAMSMLNPAQYEAELIAYADAIKGKIKGNSAVNEFVTKMDGLKLLSVGQPAPDFTMNTPDGKAVKLADLKGKYVLLDFWASWCAPCREENPNVVRVYNQFKDKGFTVLGISIDKDKEAWQKAIKQDRLDWTHVSELKDFDGDVVRQYKIEAIPSSFLLDPTGKIIAKNLRGNELLAFLNKTIR